MSDLLRDVLCVLESFSSADDGQRRLRAEYLAHLAQRPDGIWRDGPPAHLTASCFVLDPGASAVLLTLHRKGGFWVQFGGHLEPADSNLAGAALREATEESGLTSLVLLPGPVGLHRHALSGAFGRCREHLDVTYAAIAAAGSMPRVSAESKDVAWWPIDALPAGAVPDLADRLEQVRALVLGPESGQPTSSDSSIGASRAPVEKPSRKPRARSVPG